MKNSLFRFFLLVLPLLSLDANELLWVDDKIAAIKPARVGLSDDVIAALSNPFNSEEEKQKLNEAKKATNNSVQSEVPKIIKKKKVKAISANFRLDALMNTSALINGKWYKRGQKVGDYKLSHVGDNYVVLSNKYTKKTLSIKSATKKLNFKNN